MKIEEILSLEPCDCGRPWCQFFGAGIGEYGQSFSREEIEDLLEGMPKIERHLRAILVPTKTDKQ